MSSKGCNHGDVKGLGRTAGDRSGRSTELTREDNIVCTIGSGESQVSGVGEHKLVVCSQADMNWRFRQKS